METQYDPRLVVSDVPLDWDTILKSVEDRKNGVPFVPGEESLAELRAMIAKAGKRHA